MNFTLEDKMGRPFCELQKTHFKMIVLFKVLKYHYSPVKQNAFYCHINLQILNLLLALIQITENNNIRKQSHRKFEILQLNGIFVEKAAK